MTLADTPVGMGLDEYQKAFCNSEATNIRLLAPAGSGKTHSLLYRCVHVADRLEGKGRFLVVTFTRAARDELRARLAHPPFSAYASSIEVTTLNSWGWKRVRAQHSSPRLLSKTDRNFAVQNNLQPIWKAWPSVAGPMQRQAHIAGKALLLIIDQLKSLGFDHVRHDDRKTFDRHVATLQDLGVERMLDAILAELRDLQVLTFGTIDEFYGEFFGFWREASKALMEQAVFTLEDQKYVAFLDIQRQLEDQRLPIGGSRITDILVDEFQDINPLDLALIKGVLDLNRANLTIVGDDDQAIFEWRGATPSYILEPDKWFGRPFKTFILEKNYRCPRNLVDHSQRLIVHNKRRVAKRVEAVSDASAKIDVVRKPTFAEAVDHVVGEIDAFVASLNGHRRKIALVSRKRAQLIPYQVILAGRNVPFCAAEDLQVFLSQAFESLTNMLEARALSDSPRLSGKVIEDMLSLCARVKRFPLSKSDANKVGAHLRVARPRTLADALDALEAYRGPLKGDNSAGLMSHAFANSIRALLNAQTVSEAIDAIGDHFSGLAKDYGKAQEDIFFSDPPFFYLSQFARRYGGDFDRFLEDIQIAADTLAQVPADDDALGPDDVWTRPVHLMTALRAKGKEFDTVVLLDVNDGIWPTRQAETEAQKEQERRVFYVAMTRAKRRLICTVSGQIGDHAASPSPFLIESGVL